MKRIKQWAKELKSQLLALHYAYQHPGCPAIAKFVAGVTLLYALSPIDLIPDFIPVLGLLDDLILLPIGIYLAVKLIPEPVWKVSLNRARETPFKLQKNPKGLIIIGLIWLGIIALALAWYYRQ